MNIILEESSLRWDWGGRRRVERSRLAERTTYRPMGDRGLNLESKRSTGHRSCAPSDVCIYIPTHQHDTD